MSSAIAFVLNPGGCPMRGCLCHGEGRKPGDGTPGYHLCPALIVEEGASQQGIFRGMAVLQIHIRPNHASLSESCNQGVAAIIMLQIIKQVQKFIVGLLMAAGIALLGFRLCGVQINRRSAEQLHLHTSHTVFKNTAGKAAVCLSEMQCFFLLNLTGTAGVCGFLFGVLWQVFIGGRGNVHIPTLTHRRPLSIEKEFFGGVFHFFGRFF